jgi:hypothetical protein
MPIMALNVDMHVLMVWWMCKKSTYQDFFVVPSSTVPSSDRPTCDSCIGSDACNIDAVNHLNLEATRVLWHQRLGHMHFRKVSELHKHVGGIPKSVISTYIDGCPSCWVCKILRTNRGSAYTRKDATVVGQGISMDWGFIVQCSKTKGCNDKISEW